jgi:hypothetical protein
MSKACEDAFMLLYMHFKGYVYIWSEYVDKKE